MTEVDPEFSQLLTQVAELYMPLSPSFQIARWKQIQLIAERHAEEETEPYEGSVVYPLAAVIYFLHYLAITPEHKGAWGNIIQIAESEIRRLSTVD